MKRLYVDPKKTSLNPGSNVTLSPESSSYLVRVLRLHIGDSLHCFDGVGQEYEARLTVADSRSTLLQLGKLSRSIPTPTPRLVLLTALVKHRVETVVQQATELGATHINVIIADRTQARLPKPERLIKVIRDAAEQCGRVWIPELNIGIGLESAISHCDCGRKLIAVPKTEVTEFSNDLMDTCVAIGPEGDWSSSELQLARDAGFEPIGLGPIILRNPTAAAVALSLIRQGWQWQVPQV
ncbi:MAG: RsmE family RNA methyltransferase [Pseudomonadales bacterium]